MRYSYYWLTSANELKIGWDNALHHARLENFPHHKHAGWKENRQPSVGSLPHIQVTPAYARRQVNGLMLDCVSHLLLAGDPRLTYMDRWYWRVPVDLTFPSRGRVGSVGEVDVDATLGKVTVSDELLDQIARRADRLARTVLETPVVESTVKNG